MCRTPLYELLVGDGFWRGGIIHELRASLRGDVGLDGNSLVATTDADVARGIDSAVECLTAKVAEVVGKQVLCRDVEVEGEVGEFVMVDGSGEHGFRAVDVVDGEMSEGNLVGNERDRVATQLVVAA